MADPQPLEYGKQRRRRWVTVASFSTADMAGVAKLQLDAEDIPNYLDNERTAMMLWHIQPAVGGVLLKVPEEFEEEAREVLRNEDPDPADQDQDDEYDYEDDDAIIYSRVIRCPRCHSTDTEPLTWKWRITQAVIIVLLGMWLTIHPAIPLIALGCAALFLWSKPSHRCLRCRHRFNASAAGR